MTTYVRTRGGAMVHLAGCRYDVNSTPWDWAEGKTVPEIRMILTLRGLDYDWCRLCFPRPRGGDQ